MLWPIYSVCLPSTQGMQGWAPANHGEMDGDTTAISQLDGTYNPNEQ